MSGTEDADTVEQAKELVQLCRQGKLYLLEKWIADAKSLDISSATKRGRRRSLLELAVETGFHSLVELIAKHDRTQSGKDAALNDAVASRRLDLVELLMANGADIKSVPLADVLLTWEPKLIRFFLDHGADPVEGRPFAEAFGSKVRTALRPFSEYKRAHPEFTAQLQEQLDCALRRFCGEGDMKWVSLLMWAGGDPRSRGPVLGKDYTDDPECYTSGLEEACEAENVEVLKKLRPEATRDDLSRLLYCATVSGRHATVKYLLEVGANPNDKPNGGSKALDTALWRFSFARFDPYGVQRLRSKYDLWQAFECLRELLQHGAIWDQDDQYSVNSLRRTLLECEPNVTVELLKLFRQHNACPAERVHKLLGTPRMKEHLKTENNALLRLGIHLDVVPNASRRGLRNQM